MALPSMRVALVVLAALLPDVALARKGKKAKRATNQRHEGGQAADRIQDQDLEEWKAAADAELAPRVTLLPRDAGMEPMFTRMTKQDFNPNFGTIYTATGDLITKHEQIQDGAALIAVPSATQLGRHNPGRFFTWPLYPVGSRFTVKGIERPDGEGPDGEAEFPEVELEVLHTDPKVFWVHYLFSDDEADTLIEEAQTHLESGKSGSGIDGEGACSGPLGNQKSQPVQESVEGLGPDQRTDSWTTLGIESSQPANQQSATAKKISQRIFDLLRLDYDPTIADGLHVSKFETAQGAAPHYDATLPGLDSAPAEHNWSVRRDGTNRWAAVRLFLEDVEEGGETVFMHAEPPEDQTWAPEVPGGVLEDGSWEQELAEACREAFIIPPEKGGALLYYPMQPDGQISEQTLQGTCPVLEGEGWMAQMWIWNGCRYGATGPGCA